METPKRPLIERAVMDAARDRTEAERFLEAANVQGMHSLCLRMIAEREQLAEAFNSVIRGWSLINDKANVASDDSVAAIERIAHESMQMAREFVAALMKREGGS